MKKTGLLSSLHFCKSASIAIASFFSSVWFWLFFMAISGAVFLSIGVSIEFGHGYGLISAGFTAMIYALIILKAIRND